MSDTDSAPAATAVARRWLRLLKLLLSVLALALSVWRGLGAL